MKPIKSSSHSATQPSVIDAALRVAELSLRIHPLHGKQPLLADWPNRASSDPTQIAQWLQTGHNYGIVCDEIAVIDTDTPELAEWWLCNQPNTPWMVKTPSGGVHFYYRSVPGLRNAVRVHRGWDVRAGGRGYVVGSGSQINGRRYELSGEITLDLSPFDPAWLPKRPELPEPYSGANPHPSRGGIRNVRRYIRVIPSIQGQNGSGACFRVACILRDHGFSFDEALLEMVVWNEVCADPIWSVNALHKKLRDAFAHSWKGG